MIIVHIVLAVWGPYLATKVASWQRRAITQKKIKDLVPSQGETISSKVKAILLRSSAPQLWWTLGAMLGLVGLQFLLPGYPFAKVLGAIITIGVGVARGLADFKKLIRLGDQAGLREALQKSVHEDENEKVEGLLKGAWNSDVGEYQLLAVEWAAKWKSPWAVKLLKEISEISRDYEVRNLTESAFKGGKALTEGNEVDHINNLVDLVEQSRFWLRFALSFQNKGTDILSQEEIEGMNPKLVSAFQLQGELVASHPHNFCKQGLTRGRMLNRNGWHYVLGNASHDYRQIEVGITKVVGQIGPEMEQETETGTLRLPLWDAINNKATPMELDAINIVGGAEFNYDWAVSASIEALRNRFPEKELKLDVTFDPSLSLSANTRALLQEISALS